MVRRFSKWDSASVVERFWARVSKGSGCWNWCGNTTPNGYGSLSAGKRGAGNFLAHRLSYQLAFGPIRQDAVIMHVCDNRLCVRPSHLRQGTQKENIQDALKKGRMLGPRGVAQGRSKLTEGQVREIRQALLEGVRQRVLAGRFKVSASTISMIGSRRRWEWLT
jgi:hypothetical protein